MLTVKVAHYVEEKNKTIQLYQLIFFCNIY